MKNRPVQPHFFVCLAAIAALLLGACGKKPPPQPTWSFEPNAIQINYTSDPMLNSFDGRAHTLLLVIYQLTDVNAWSDLAKGEPGLRKLLQAQKFDQSVVSLDKYIIQPSEDKAITLYRSENARWVALVAGYYQLFPGKSSMAFDIPVLIKKHGLIFRKTTATVEHLPLNLFFGPTELHELQLEDEEF